MLRMLGKISADDNWKYFFSYFSLKIGSDISCKLSAEETICIKCQHLFSGKKKIDKYHPVCSLLNLPTEVKV